MWPIIYVWSTSELKLNCQDLSNRVQSVMKTRQGIDLTDRTDVVYAKNEIELSRPIGRGAVCDEK